MAEITRLSQLSGLRLLVWGGGKEARATVHHVVANHCTVTLVSDDPTSDVRTEELARQFNLEIITPDRLAVVDADFVVRSPGVVKYRTELASLSRRGVGSSNLLALWLADQDPHRVIAVTGTKGKSTTATLIAHLLSASGRKVSLVGNIGVAVTAVSADSDVVVVEVSSYQAADCTTSPSIGVLTSLDQDHLQWHGSVRTYHRDKLNLFAHPQLDHLVCDSSDHAIATAISEFKLRPPTPIDPVLNADDLRLIADTNPHHVELTLGPFLHNLQLATVAARCFDPFLTMTQIEHVVRTFEPLPSRQKVVGVHGGVTYVDDALASNPLGVLAALDTFQQQRIVLILGGHDRGVDYSPLIERLEHSPNVTELVLLGGPNDSIAHQFADSSRPIHVVGSHDLGDAVRIAITIASPGSFVIFSPGAPTPPDLGTYEDRSATFVKAVARHA